MRHNRRVKHFSRKYNARKALFRGLVESLVEHGRIKTTLAKAKELRRVVEKAITVGKRGTLSARRNLISKYPSAETANLLVDQVAPRFQNRNGGYTRIVKLGPRPGDIAEMAFIEFVDFDFAAKSLGRETVKSDEKSKKKPKAKAASATKKASSIKKSSSSLTA